MTIERELLKRFMTELKTEEDVVSLFNDIKECLAEPEQPEQDLEVLKKDWVNFGYEAGRKSALSKQEPVAWIIETEIHGKLSEWICTDKKHYMEEHDSIKEPIPLYTTPPKHEPLSDGEITDLWANKSPANEFECVRLVEKAHGIGGEE